MSAVLYVRKRDRGNHWMTLDMSEDEGIGAVVVFPLFGPEHRAGADCFCCPECWPGLIIHNAVH